MITKDSLTFFAEPGYSAKPKNIGKYAEFIKTLKSLPASNTQHPLYYKLEKVLNEKEVSAIKAALYAAFPRKSEHRIVTDAMPTAGGYFVFRFAKILR